ncbi:MAG: hypothetical protein FWG34_03400 [Oscillospiraceae bacterium]|nr:hypothetical protein [Oscillospiraceae bacterium]
MGAERESVPCDAKLPVIGKLKGHTLWHDSVVGEAPGVQALFRPKQKKARHGGLQGRGRNMPREAFRRANR